MLTSFKTELKQNFSDLKSGIQKDKWFLISLSVLTILFVLSMFFEPVVYVICVAVAIIAVVFDFNKILNLFLFVYPFSAVFFVKINGATHVMLTYLIYLLVAICCVKYVIKLFKENKNFNLKLIVPMFLMLLYMLLPINSINVKSLAMYFAAFAMFYLLVEQKNDVNIKSLVVYASVALILASVLSYLSPLTYRLPKILPIYTNFKVIKFEGLFVNPNIYAIVAGLLLPVLVYFCTQKGGLLWFVLLIPISCFSYMTLSRNYLICLCLTLVFFLVAHAVKKDKKALLRYAFVAFVVVVVALCEFNYSRVYLARFNIIDPSTIVESELPDVKYPPKEEDVKPSEPPAEFWIDGTPIDPGRIGIWKRYLKDFSSSAKNIIFGVGVSEKQLGIASHNFYIEFLWRFGLMGLVFAVIAIAKNFKKLTKGFKNNLFLSVLINFLFIGFIDSIFFNEKLLFALILIVSAFNNRENDYKKNGDKNLDEKNLDCKQ